MRVEQSTRKGKARAPAPEVCTRCIEKMLLCKLGTGKSTSCQVCKAAKAWCKRPGEEEVMEVDEEEVRELSMEGPKEVEELEEGPGKVEGSKQGVEASGSAEVEKGSQSAESAESGRNGGDDMEV